MASQECSDIYLDLQRFVNISFKKVAQVWTLKIMLIYLELASHVKLWELPPSLCMGFPLTDVSRTVHSLYQDEL